MTKNKGKGQILEFKGERLTKPIDYVYEWSTFDSPAEMREAGQWPNDADILEQRNDKAEAVAKSGKYQAAAKLLRELDSRTYESRKASFINTAVTSGMEREEAEEAAKRIPILQRHVEAAKLLERVIAGEDVGEIDFAALDANKALA